MANEYTIDTYLNRGGNYNMYGMTEDMMNRSYGDIKPQLMSNNLPYQAGTLVDAPLSVGAFPWLVAGGTALGYGAGQLDARGVPLLPDQTSYPMEGPMRLAGRGTGDELSGPTRKHAEKLAMESGLQMALDDNGYPVLTEGSYGGASETYLTEGPYAFKNMGPRRGIYDLHGTGPMTQHQEGTTYLPYEEYAEDALRTAQKELAAFDRQLENELAGEYQDSARRGPLQDGTSISVSDNRTEFQKWKDSFKRDW